MGFDTREFLVLPGTAVDLRQRATRVAPVYSSDEQYQEMLSRHVAQGTIRQLVIVPGQRGTARIESADRVTLGGDGLRRHQEENESEQAHEIS